jgi:hypothetical protein
VWKGRNWRYRELLLDESHHPPGDERGERAASGEPPGRASGDPHDGHHHGYDGYHHGYYGHRHGHNGYYDATPRHNNYCHHGHDDGCANRDDHHYHHRRYHIGAGYYY